ncbi:MAG: hypothetical protein KC426_06120 [Oceanospirillaceae bacterium]|nr:hypothetical protein [Oceanospirillaceae bacterium]
MMTKVNQWLIAFACLLLVTVALCFSWLRLGISDHPIYHQWVESQVSQSIGQDLTLEAFEVKLVGTSLRLNLRGLKATNDLTLAHLTLGVDLLESFQTGVVTLSHVQATSLGIEVRQDANGRWGAAPTHRLQTIMVLATKLPQLLLDDALVTLIPYQGQPISLPKLNAQFGVSTVNSLTRVNVSLYGGLGSTTLNDDFKAQLILDINTSEEAHTLSQAKVTRAQVYVNAKSLEVLHWWSLIMPSDSPFYPDNLRIGGEYWVDYQPTKTVELVTKNAHLAFMTQMDTVELTSDVQATLQLGQSADNPWAVSNWSLTAQSLTGTVNEAVLPLSRLTVLKNNQQFVIQSPILHLAHAHTLLSTVDHLPTKVAMPVAALAPKGELSQVQLFLDVNQPREFLLTGNLQQASVEAWAGVPQINHADGRIWLNRHGGKVAINDVDGISLKIPKLTEFPWQFSTLQGEFNWHYGALSNRMSSSNVTANLTQGQVNLSMAGEFPRRGSSTEPFIQLALGMQNLNIAHLPKMLPNKVLGQKLGQWISKAAPIGTVTQAALIYNGRSGKVLDSAHKLARSLSIDAQLEIPSFTYHEKWPQVKGLAANLFVNSSSALITLDSGTLAHSGMSAKVDGWQVEVPIYSNGYTKGYITGDTTGNTAADLTNNPEDALVAQVNKAYINVQGQLSGEAQAMMTLAQQLPLNIQLPQWLQSIKPEGNVSLKGGFGIPFGHQAKATYDFKLSSNNLHAFWAPLQADIRQVEFEVGLNSSYSGIGDVFGNGLIDGQAISVKRLSKVDLAMPWLGNIPQPILDDVKVNARGKKDQLALQFEGQLPSHYLQTKMNQPWTQEITGVLPFVVRLSTCAKMQAQCALSLSAQVDLNSAGIALPEPLNQLQQLQVVGNWQQGQQDYYASIDDQQIAIKLDTGKALDELSVVGLNIGFQQSVDWAKQDQWKVDGHLDRVDIAAWWSVYQHRIKAWGRGQYHQNVSPSKPIVPLVNVTIKHAQWSGLDINQAQVTLGPLATTDDLVLLNPWRLNITSDNLLGHVDYFGAQLPLAINVEKALFNFPETPEETTQTFDVLENIDPKKLLDANVSIQSLVKNGEPFGKWEFKIRREGEQLYVHDLDASIRHSKLQGNLIWDKLDGVHRTQFIGRAESDDMANMLMAWGYEPGLKAQTSSMEIQLNWPRSPLAFQLKETTGDLGLRLKNGSILSSRSAADGLKVLALLDVGRLINRVKLDFSDIIQPGFNFDSVTSHYRFDEGMASTVTPSTFKSSTLNLTMDGWIDFNNRQVDNNLIITLPVADKLPLAALIVGLPQLGGMMYVVNKLIGDELATFTSARYHVVGSLDKPTVQLVRFFDKDYQQQSVQERIENVLSIE